MRKDKIENDSVVKNNPDTVEVTMKKEICFFLGLFWTLDTWYHFSIKHIPLSLISGSVFFYLSGNLATGIFMTLATLAILRGFWSLSRKTFGDILPKLAIQVGLN